MEKIEKLPLDIDSILFNFGLPRLREGHLMAEWISADGEMAIDELTRLKKLHKKTLTSGDGWNEEELKIKFLSLLFDLADIEIENQIVSFYERAMSAVINDFKISVVCDCLLASPAGISTPRVPYFFLQEFKKQKGDSNDPEAQMLAAMIVAQYKNANQEPIYGAWLVGSTWNFTILNGKEYFVSRKFDAANFEQLRQIVFILRKLKDSIVERYKL
jgi:hypothetical protein